MSKLDSKTLDDLMSGCKTPDDFKNLMQQFMQRTLQAALNTELEEHLGYKKHDASGKNSGNSRNGTTPKTVRSDNGEIEIHFIYLI